MSKRRLTLLCLAMAFSTWGCAPMARAEGEDKVAIIVNADNPVTELTADQVADMFLKRKRQWSDGQSVRFIDRKDSSPERSAFLRSFIKKSARELDLFWIGQKLYTGDSAPIQVPSDAMAASFVGRFRGAIAYVSPDFTGAKGVKKIEISSTP